jgi:hypothetical protein
MNTDNFPLLTVAKPYHYSFSNNKLKIKNYVNICINDLRKDIRASR